MPPELRLEMYIKYSQEPWCDRVLQALPHWDAAADLVCKREGFMRSLAALERVASDPTRLLSKRACAFLKSLEHGTLESKHTVTIDRSKACLKRNNGQPGVVHRSRLHYVSWLTAPSASKEPLTFSRVEPGVGGVVQLSDGSAFKNPPAKVSDRLTEAQERGQLCNIIAKKSRTIAIIYENLLFDFDDVVTYGGRPYLDKMEKDYVEMLHDLERERLDRAKIRPPTGFGIA